MISALQLGRWVRVFERSHVPSVLSLGRILYSSAVFPPSGVRERKVQNCSREKLTVLLLIPSANVIPTIIPVVPR